MSEARNIGKPPVRYVALTRQAGAAHARLKDAIAQAQANETAPANHVVARTSLAGTFPEWYLKARNIDRDELKTLFGQRWVAQSALDKLTDGLEYDIQDFAEPLLTQALKNTLKIELDVRSAQLHLYVPSKLIFGIDTGANRLRKMTLLDAAIHNFEADEAKPNAFSEGSGVFTLDAEGAPLRHALSVEKFVTLCRDLDLGAQYQAHLKDILMPAAATDRVVLQRLSVANDKASFKSAALIGYLRGEITLHAYGQLLAVHDGKPERLLHGAPMLNHRLSLMGFKLTGITLFSAVREPSLAKQALDALSPPGLSTLLNLARQATVLPGQEFERVKLLKEFFANGPKGLSATLLRHEDQYRHSRLTGSVLVYIPDDPDHPVKEYSSFTEFMKTLVSQLRGSDYQKFFARFVAQKDQAVFFSRVKERFTTFTWHQREPLDMGPWWRETAVENPDPEPITNLITHNLWSTLFTERRDKLIADARQIAVPTDDEDAQSRWKRITGYLDIAWNIFNFGAMLVPGLGEAALGLMAAQLLEELAEGIEDWSKGDREEAAAHIVSVLINGAQLAMMGVGHVLPRGVPTPVRPSPVFDSLKPVELPDGRASLWKPDLRPYEQTAQLPSHVRPDRLGLYRHNGKTLLPLENKRYQVETDPATGLHRIEHPTRPNAYRPDLASNGTGAWATELEQPLTWDDNKVWQRLGSSLEEFSAARQAQIRTVSGVDPAVLRRLHVEHEGPPPLLVDTLKRFKAYAVAEDLPRQLLDNRISEELEGYVPTFVTELPGWPSSRAVEVFESPSLTGDSIRYGAVDAPSAQTIRVNRAQLRAGQLPEQVLDTLSENEIQDLLGKRIGADRGERLDALRARLSMHAKRQTSRLFESLYKTDERLTDPRQLTLENEFPTLPRSLANPLLEQLTTEERAFIVEKNRLPLRVKSMAREALRNVRLNRAYEGLYLEALAGADSQRLALHSIEGFAGWSKELRIEVRELSFDGPLLDSVGPENAPVRKVLVVNENAQFEARDAQDLHLHGADNLYGALLHALPDTERAALGYEITQGAQLEQAVQQQPLSHERFAPILDQQPVRKPAYDPEQMKLLGGMRRFWRPQNESKNVRYRAQSLYPSFSDRDLDRLIEDVVRAGGEPAQHISALEQEFDQLVSDLNRWVEGPTRTWRLTPAGVAEWESRHHIASVLRRCWQRTGPRGVEAAGEAHPQSLILDDVMLDRHMTSLPRLRANFDHVTRLSLRKNNLLSSQMAFLKPFRRLRALDMRENLLNRLPEAIGDMPYLFELLLSENQIVLTPTAVARLRQLTRLEILSLVDNPLGRVPDVSRMRRLRVLMLDNTAIDTWPVGIFGKPRPRDIFLDLRRNYLQVIPDVAPGSVRAEILARTFVTRTPPFMSPQMLEQLKLYSESVGLDPERPYPGVGTLDSMVWADGMSGHLWRGRQKLWDLLEDEHGSEPFFNRIRGLTESADFKAGGAYRANLSEKVWRMLAAMGENVELREKLFNEAVASTECVDGLTQWFNAMGVRVLIHEAYALANKGLVEAELVTLAKGKSRLLQLDTISRHRVSERLAAGETMRRVNAGGVVVGTIDEVEVHLAYMTDLAERLDLPWQARGMQFRNMAGVTQTMIDDAYQRVLALEEGDLLRDSIAELPFWKEYIEGSNRQAFNALRRRADATTAFKVAMDERANAVDLDADAKAQIKQDLRVLATELGKPESEIATGVVMTDEAYDKAFKAILDEMDALLKKLTRESMDRAKL